VDFIRFVKIAFGIRNFVNFVDRIVLDVEILGVFLKVVRNILCVLDVLICLVLDFALFV
jgi:hypothetical protein